MEISVQLDLGAILKVAASLLLRRPAGAKAPLRKELRVLTFALVPWLSRVPSSSSVPMCRSFRHRCHGDASALRRWRHHQESHCTFPLRPPPRLRSASSFLGPMAQILREAVPQSHQA